MDKFWMDLDFRHRWKLASIQCFMYCVLKKIYSRFFILFFNSLNLFIYFLKMTVNKVKFEQLKKLHKFTSPIPNLTRHQIDGVSLRCNGKYFL